MDSCKLGNVKQKNQEQQEATPSNRYWIVAGEPDFGKFFGVHSTTTGAYAKIVLVIYQVFKLSSLIKKFY